MGRIIKLPRNVSEKIAAGEVVERPSSVVKELVENSLDAQATDIRIELLEGGKKFIRVSDNGDGMSREDAVACFENYATSKISSIEDLAQISSLGFRGEALASIAAVSRITLRTSDVSREKGTMVVLESKESLDVVDTSFPLGTSVEVRDLFFNLPARKKFLRSDRAELTRIIKHLTDAALAHPQVRFSLSHGSRRLFMYPPVTTLNERIFQIFGKTVLDKLIEIDAKDGEHKLHGFVSRPPLGRGDRRYQLFFVNSRPVKDRNLQAALSQAMKNFLEKGSFPESFLFISLPAEEVDINVHPAKVEVRFQNSSRIFHFVFHSIEQAAIKEMSLKEIRPSRQEPGEPFPIKQEYHQPSGIKETGDRQTFFQEAVFPKKDEKRSATRVFGQYQNSYIVAAEAEGILIIDQHNAHERVLFDRYLEIGREKNWPRKMALNPQVIQLSPSQVLCLEENHNLLEESGFRVDAVGGKSYALKEYPDIFKEAEAADVFLTVLEDVGKEKVEQKREKLLASLACKTAIKAGEILSMERMNYLVEELDKSEHKALCPHGRPIIVQINNQQIEKSLKRK